MFFSSLVDNIIKKLEDFGYDTFLAGTAVLNALEGRLNQEYSFYSRCSKEELQMVLKDYTYQKEKGCFEQKMDQALVSVYPISNQSLLSVLSDFTICMLYYHPNKGIIDLVHGMRDLKMGLIKPFFSSEKSIQSKPNLILKAILLAGTYEFTIEHSFIQYYYQHQTILNKIDEKERMVFLHSFFKISKIGKLLREYSFVFTYLFPELALLIDRKEENISLLEETITAIDYCQKNARVRLAILFHLLSPSYLQAIFSRYESSIDSLILLWIQNQNLPLENEEHLLYLSKNMKKEDLKDYFIFRRTISLAKREFDLIETIDTAEEKTYYLIQTGKNLDITMLEIHSDDLIKLGFPKNMIKKVLQKIQKEVYLNHLSNQKEELLEYAKTLISLE